MSENIRTNIQAKVCRVVTKLNDLHLYGVPESDINEIRATLYHILDQLDQSETMEHLANRFKKDSLQFFMQVS